MKKKHFKGLRYKIDNNLNTCEITTLSDINDSEISPAEFFKFDQVPPFQYVGQVKNYFAKEITARPRKHAQGPSA